MPRILFNITHGFQARMLLRSSIAETLLSRGVELVVVSQSSREAYFRQEFDHPQILLEDMPFRASRVESHLMTLRQYLLMNPALGQTLNHKNEAFRQQAPLRYWLARSGNAVLGRIPLLRRAYMSAEAGLFPGSEFDALLHRHRPDLVVTGTPGYNPADIHLLRSARRLGFPTATVMLSWDNLTSKGYMNGVPDSLLVWSDLMADEAVEYHNYPREQIHWCGAAQFDHYHGIRERLDRMAWRRAHGVPENAGLIVYGTVNPAIVPHEIEIVRSIVGAMRAHRFVRPVYLWIRLHPQVVRGVYSQSLQPYRDLAGDDVFVETPPVQSDKLAWDLPKSDAEHLAKLLAAADAVVTPNSTLSIDAACADTPILNVLFDGERPVPTALSVRRFLQYTHSAKILRTNGISVATSLDEFVPMVNDYLRTPQLHQAERAAMVRQQMNLLDGQAGLRTAELLLNLADGRVPHAFAGRPNC